MKARNAVLGSIGAAGAVVGYGCLAAFLGLVGLQTYRWFRDGQWTHIGVGDALRMWLAHFNIKDGDTGSITAFMHWLDAPASWSGLHRVIEVIPASLALFALSIAGNSLFIYCRDRLEGR